MRVVVPFPPGGGIDVMSRHVTQQLSGAFGVQFIDDNRAGAGGAIGTVNFLTSPCVLLLMFGLQAPMSEMHSERQDGIQSGLHA